jgi:hypothetical protein
MVYPFCLLLDTERIHHLEKAVKPVSVLDTEPTTFHEILGFGQSFIEGKTMLS